MEHSGDTLLLEERLKRLTSRDLKHLLMFKAKSEESLVSLVSLYVKRYGHEPFEEEKLSQLVVAPFTEGLSQNAIHRSNTGYQFPTLNRFSSTSRYPRIPIFLNQETLLFLYKIAKISAQRLPTCSTEDIKKLEIECVHYCLAYQFGFVLPFVVKLAAIKRKSNVKIFLERLTTAIDNSTRVINTAQIIAKLAFPVGLSLS